MNDTAILQHYFQIKKFFFQKIVLSLFYHSQLKLFFMSDKKENLAIYFSISITITFVAIWKFGGNIDKAELFVYYVFTYCVVLLAIFLAPKKIIE